MPQVSISFNQRTYRFQCGEGDVERFERLASYVKATLDGLIQEHGSTGDERLMLMAALTLADELFDARSDIDDLLDDNTETLKVLAHEGNVKTSSTATRRTGS